jgi:LacI family transcriptional regulator
LKRIAEHLDLSIGTISIVLNDTPAARTLRPETRQRVREAARRLGYRRNELARSLRNHRTKLVGVLMPGIQSHYASGVVAGLEGYLAGQGYSYLACSHHNDRVTAEEQLSTLLGRQIDGLVLIATPEVPAPPIPCVKVAGRQRRALPDVVIDHDQAATRALSHLLELGHERIAFFKGPPMSSDTMDRWRAIRQSAQTLGVEVVPERVRQLRDGAPAETQSPRGAYEEGYAKGQSLLEGKVDFTALFAFNDLSAIGAMRAFLDAGLRVPEDVSIIGFDDIYSSPFHRPGLTTLRQPLEQMGEAAGRLLLSRLEASDDAEAVSGDGPLCVEAELVVRGSTGLAPSRQGLEACVGA